MASQLTTLTSADVRRFERDGYVVVRQAFSRDDGLAMERRWWRELEDAHGIARDDRSSWRRLPGDLKAAKRDPEQATILTGRVRGVFDDLLGQGAWPPPRDWGRPLVTFPEPGAWDLPTGQWHWDNPCELHLDRPRGLFVVSFIGSVEPRSGGTLILSGSPRLLIRQERELPASQRRGAASARTASLTYPRRSSSSSRTCNNPHGRGAAVSRQKAETAAPSLRRGQGEAARDSHGRGGGDRARWWEVAPRERGSSMAQHHSGHSYHDDSDWPHLELGPSDDRRYVEQLFKAIFQAGLSWPVVESHWPAFSEVFHGFDPVQVAAMTEEEMHRVEHNPQIIRNHRKIHEAVESAAAVNDVVARYGSFDAYLRSFGSPEEEITDLKRRFAGLGDYSAWWFMDSVGLPLPPANW